MAQTATTAESTSFPQNLKQMLIRQLHAIGVDPRKLIALRHMPKYLRSYSAFKKAGGNISHVYPVLGDFAEQAGSASSHYFHQDLLVAKFIHDARPTRHIDVGSRIDGFVAHVAAFREIEVLDVRLLKDTSHANIKFVQADLMNGTAQLEGVADSVSCLHALEHFGLGRYGDSIDPNGHVTGLGNILKLLRPGGTLYISFPIANATAVYFNAHRAFHPRDIFSWIGGKATLQRFDYVDDGGALIRNFPIESSLPDVRDGCGIYTFRKIYC